MLDIVKLTNHPLNEDQILDLKKEGYSEILDVPEDLRKILLNSKEYLSDIKNDVEHIINYLKHIEACAVFVPAGSPAFMAVLSRRLKECNISMIFSHSERVSKEVTKENGTVEKVSVFEHKHLIIV